MTDLFEKVFRNFKDFFAGLDFNKKIAMVGTAAFIVAGIATMIIWVSKTRYEILYSDLNKEDSKKIAVLLGEGF